MGFSVTSKHLKRAGLDYWDEVEVNIIDEFILDERPCYFYSTKASRLYTEVCYEPNARLIFGSESAGIPSFYHETYKDNFYTIPMRSGVRSLNLSNSVAIVLYEALRQQSFKNL